MFHGHTLYSHAPGGRFETERQAHYAGWIARSVPAQPRSVGDIGCGNGSLILALRQVWPAVKTWGVEPSDSAASQARAAGIEVRTGYLDGAERLPTAELVLAVNVVEHTHDPVSFLKSLARCIAPGGRLLVVCPDGMKIGTELLMFDHLHSFTECGLRRLLGLAGFRVLAAPDAPPPLHDFQMAVAVPGAASASGGDHADMKALHGARTAFLSAWGSLQDRLSATLEPEQKLVCFGVGETAHLLRVYAPRLWSRVELCVSDDAPDGLFAGLPATQYRKLPPNEARPVLLAVRGAAQRRLADRLTNEGRRVLTWDVGSGPVSAGFAPDAR